MSERTKAKTTPEEKAAWQKNKNLHPGHSWFIFVGTARNGFAFPTRKFDASGRRIR